MNAESAPGEEEGLSREEIVARDVERRRREHEELQRRIDERCREAEAKWKAAHPWIGDHTLCIGIPVKRLDLSGRD